MLHWTILCTTASLPNPDEHCIIDAVCSVCWCLQGSLKPDVAMNALAIFEGRFTRLSEERQNVSKAKEALELAEPGQLAGWR